MTPRAEELWSYITGLAPVGEPVFLVREWLEEDLGMRNRFMTCNRLQELEKAGVISRVAPRTFTVLSRPGPSRRAPVSRTPKPRKLIPYAGASA